MAKERKKKMWCKARGNRESGRSSPSERGGREKQGKKTKERRKEKEKG